MSCASCISVSSRKLATCSFFIFGLEPKRVTSPAACHVAPEQSWLAFSSNVTCTPARERTRDGRARDPAADHDALPNWSRHGTVRTIGLRGGRSSHGEERQNYHFCNHYHLSIRPFYYASSKQQRGGHHHQQMSTITPRAAEFHPGRHQLARLTSGKFRYYIPIRPTYERICTQKHTTRQRAPSKTDLERPQWRARCALPLPVERWGNSLAKQRARARSVKETKKTSQ